MARSLELEIQRGVGNSIFPRVKPLDERPIMSREPMQQMSTRRFTAETISPDIIEGAFCSLDEMWEIRIERNQGRRARFEGMVELWGQSLVLRGKPKREVRDMTLSRLYEYGRATPKARKVESLNINEEIRSNFSIVFNAGLGELLGLLAETGRSAEDTDRTLSMWGRIFKGKSTEKLPEELKHLATEINHLLAVRFPHYVQELEEYLIKRGESKADARTEANQWRANFEQVKTEAEKGLISGSLRERLQVTPSREFSALIGNYRRLIEVDVIHANGKGFISEQEWISKFKEAKHTNAQAKIVEALRFVVSRATEKGRPAEGIFSY